MVQLFIVEDGYNTSYIDSLFVSLFYKSSYIQNILSDMPVMAENIYLQELIYENFVRKMRHNYTIDTSTVNEIRNYMIMCGWNDNIGELHRVQDVYTFLIDAFNSKKIELLHNNNAIDLSYIEVLITNNSSTNMLLQKWSDKYDNLEFRSIPQFLAIYLNRSDIGKHLVDITECVQISSMNIPKMWAIHSIICFSHDKYQYYSIVLDKNEWYMFSNMKLPSLIKINIKDENIATKIKQECVFVLYTL